MTTHLTSKLIDKLESRSQESNNPPFKPRGIWFQVDNSWRDWCSNEMPEWLSKYKYEYELKIDYTDILVISNMLELKAFTTLYKQSNEIFESIDWKTVAKKYKGISIPTYLHSCRMDRRFFWYYPWDIASGCIWDVSAIKNIKLINK